MPMQYTAIFHGCKNGNFSVKKYFICLIFAQNIDCVYTLEPCVGPGQKPRRLYSYNEANIYMKVGFKEV